MRKWIGLLVTALLVGCASRQTALAPPAPGQSAAKMLSADIRQTAPAPSPGDPRIIRVLMYQLTLPFGSVSRNDAFWKLANEDCVGVAKHDLLEKNGIRVGRARIEDWPQFKQVVDQVNTSYQTATFAGASDEDVQLDMVPKVDEQTLFFFDNEGNVSGRTYGESHNRFSFRFQWAPRKLDTVRIKICAVVATSRTRDDYSASDDPIESNYMTTDRLYDLGLYADIAPGEFLVIGPTPRAQDPDRIGHQFLTFDGPTERYEKVLILVGRPLKLDKAISPTTQGSRALPVAAPRQR